MEGGDAGAPCAGGGGGGDAGLLPAVGLPLPCCNAPLASSLGLWPGKCTVAAREAADKQASTHFQQKAVLSPLYAIQGPQGTQHLRWQPVERAKPPSAEAALVLGAFRIRRAAATAVHTLNCLQSLASPVLHLQRCCRLSLPV